LWMYEDPKYSYCTKFGCRLPLDLSRPSENRELKSAKRSLPRWAMRG
jgi:hypothetical protein